MQPQPREAASRTAGSGNKSTLILRWRTNSLHSGLSNYLQCVQRSQLSSTFNRLPTTTLNLTLTVGQGSDKASFSAGFRDSANTPYGAVRACLVLGTSPGLTFCWDTGQHRLQHLGTKASQWLAHSSRYVPDTADFKGVVSKTFRRRVNSSYRRPPLNRKAGVLTNRTWAAAARGAWGRPEVSDCQRSRTAERRQVRRSSARGFGQQKF